MPAYNSGNTISGSIQSVLSQTYSKWELLVVIDGSTDDTLEKVFSFNDDRIKSINQENQGVSAARNNGVRNASGKYIAFLDSDDVWHETFLETIIHLMGECPDCVCYATNYYFVNQDKKRRLPVICGLKTNIPYQCVPNYIDILCISDPIFFTSCIVIHKQTFFSIGGFSTDIKGGEDTLLWIKFSLIGKIAYASIPLCDYMLPPPGVRKIRTSEFKDNVANELMLLIDKYPKQSKSLYHFLSHWYKIRSSTYLQHGDNKLARKYALKAYKNSKAKNKLIIYLFLSLFPSKISKPLFISLLK